MKKETFNQMVKLFGISISNYIEIVDNQNENITKGAVAKTEDINWRAFLCPECLKEGRIHFGNFILTANNCELFKPDSSDKVNLWGFGHIESSVDSNRHIMVGIIQLNSNDDKIVIFSSYILNGRKYYQVKPSRKDKKDYYNYLKEMNQ
jgi:hypothetical protein